MVLGRISFFIMFYQDMRYMTVLVLVMKVVKYDTVWPAMLQVFCLFRQVLPRCPSSVSSDKLMQLVAMGDANTEDDVRVVVTEWPE